MTQMPRFCDSNDDSEDEGYDVNERDLEVSPGESLKRRVQMTYGPGVRPLGTTATLPAQSLKLS